MARFGRANRSRTPLSRSVISATDSSWRQAMRKTGELSKTGLGLLGRSALSSTTVMEEAVMAISLIGGEDARPRALPPPLDTGRILPGGSGDAIACWEGDDLWTGW